MIDEFQNELAIKIGTAIQRIREHEPSEGYYLAFSGGKDSQTIYHLAKMSGVKFDAHFHRTTVDPPEVIDFIREYYPDVEWDRPKRSMFQLILSNSALPTRTHRFCCRALKEIGGKGRTVITGIRWEESTNRAGRPIFHESNKTKGKFFLNPIVDWSYDDIWDFLNSNRIPHCSIYNLGKTRIGCILCPFKSIDDKLDDIKRYPKFARAYRLTITKLFQKFLDRGRKIPANWKSPDDMWEWWIYGSVQDHTTVQAELPGLV